MNKKTAVVIKHEIPYLRFDRPLITICSIYRNDIHPNSLLHSI